MGKSVTLQCDLSISLAAFLHARHRHCSRSSWGQSSAVAPWCEGSGCFLIFGIVAVTSSLFLSQFGARACYLPPFDAMRFPVS